MVNSISKTTLVPDVWKNFYDRIKDQVTSVSITGSVTVTVQNYVSRFPDNLLDVKSNYPIIVVSSPKLPTDHFTYGKKEITGTITVDVYATQAEAADKLISAVNNSIETYVPDLGTVGFRKVETADADDDFVLRGKIKVHLRTTVYSFNLSFAREGY